MRCLLLPAALRNRFPLVRWESTCGAVAQLGERLVRNEEASGSIPLSSTNSLPILSPSKQILNGCAVTAVVFSYVFVRTNKNSSSPSQSCV
jgi:hypothetical protein